MIMPVQLNVSELIQCGLEPNQVREFLDQIADLDSSLSPAQCWRHITRHVLAPQHPLDVHRYLHAAVFADWDPALGPPPAWIPDNVDATNVAWLMRQADQSTYDDLYTWSITERASFWRIMVERLDVRFKERYESVLDIANGPEYPRWLTGARLNIVDSCFDTPDESTAVVYQREDGPLQSVSVADLRALVFRVANGLVDFELKPGDRVAIDMPMTIEAVAIFLGAVAAGCPVVTIADSFAPDEIRGRIEIVPVACIFTQDHTVRSGKTLPIYEKVKAAGAPNAVVLPLRDTVEASLRKGDVTWNDFLSDNTTFSTVPQSADDHTTILFSSGTTAQPKATPWDNTTPIKSAIDGHLHHDIHPGDVICWPTNLGWMMGPWLVYASLMNRATVALYYGSPATREFGRFVQNAGVTMLGLVPSLVTAWKDTACMAGLDWSRIRAFSSTGECSNAVDMLFLMSLARYKPVIEYCGGTEIGGGYITGTVVRPAAPGTFSTPALGSEMIILDEDGKPNDIGEVFLVPPAMGLSRELVNGDHHDIYYADTPPGPNGQCLRRHGDQIERLPNGYFRAHGRVDDTMNIGGIKVSSKQIEEVVNAVPDVRETAAIAVPPTEGGPARLVIYAVSAGDTQPDPVDLRARMQQEVRTRLNPLFKVHDVIMIDALPRTASNKVMRRTLRDRYRETTP